MIEELLYLTRHQRRWVLLLKRDTEFKLGKNPKPKKKTCLNCYSLLEVKKVIGKEYLHCRIHFHPLEPKL